MTAISATLEAKDDSWLDARDIAREVPGDCESIAKRLWNIVVSHHAQARGVKANGNFLVISNRLDLKGGTIPCLKATSLTDFMQAVKVTRNKQVAHEVRRAMEGADADYAPRF